MKQSLTIALVLLLISCGETKQDNPINYSKKITQHFTQWNQPGFNKPDIDMSQQVVRLANTLAQDTIVPTKLFNDAFQQLRKAATDDELILLTSHYNPVVRCHAYTALKERQYKHIHRICFEHFNDTMQKVNLHVNDGIYPLSVRTWMVYELRPGGGSRYSFEPRLYKRYIREYNDVGREMKKGSIDKRNKG